MSTYVATSGRNCPDQTILAKTVVEMPHCNTAELEGQLRLTESVFRPSAFVRSILSFQWAGCIL